MDNGTRFRYIFRSAEKEAMKKFFKETKKIQTVGVNE